MINRPDAATHTAVPASCCAKTKVDLAAAASAGEVLEFSGRLAMKSAVCDAGERSLLRFRLSVARSFFDRPVALIVKGSVIARGGWQS